MPRICWHTILPVGTHSGTISHWLRRIFSASAKPKDYSKAAAHSEHAPGKVAQQRLYRLIGADGRPYLSVQPGKLGGHRRLKGYGRLDCPSALRWIAKGYYVRHRVFFADEATAVAAGYRPCAICMPEAYRAWKAAEIRGE